MMHGRKNIKLQSNNANNFVARWQSFVLGRVLGCNSNERHRNYCTLSAYLNKVCATNLSANLIFIRQVQKLPSSHVTRRSDVIVIETVYISPQNKALFLEGSEYFGIIFLSTH